LSSKILVHSLKRLMATWYCTKHVCSLRALARTGRSGHDTDVLRMCCAAWSMGISGVSREEKEEEKRRREECDIENYHKT
jgi:hypothetical protein